MASIEWDNKSSKIHRAKIAMRNTTSSAGTINSIIHQIHNSSRKETNNIIDELHSPSLVPSAFPVNFWTSVPFEPEPRCAITEGAKASVLVPMIRSLAFGASDTLEPETVITPPGVRVWSSMKY